MGNDVYTTVRQCRSCAHDAAQTRQQRKIQLFPPTRPFRVCSDAYTGTTSKDNEWEPIRSRNYRPIFKVDKINSDCKDESYANCDHFPRPLGLPYGILSYLLANTRPQFLKNLHNFKLFPGIGKTEDDRLSFSSERTGRTLQLHDRGETSTLRRRAPTRLGPVHTAVNLHVQYANALCNRPVFNWF